MQHTVKDGLELIDRIAKDGKSSAGVIKSIKSICKRNQSEFRDDHFSVRRTFSITLGFEEKLCPECRTLGMNIVATIGSNPCPPNMKKNC